MTSTTGIIIMLLIGITGNCAFLLMVHFSNRYDQKKFEKELQRKDQETYKRNFEYMLRTVRHFIHDKSPDMYRSAIRSINDVRVAVGGAIGSMLDLLYSEVAVAGDSTVDWAKIETILAQMEKCFYQSLD